jgi:O-methyltransferase involved in polyketide biosynthesis
METQAPGGTLHFCPGQRIVPIDFEKISLAEGLSAAGLNLTASTFFSALGVTQYLSEEALDLTLKFILSIVPIQNVVHVTKRGECVTAKRDVRAAKSDSTRPAFGV